MANVPISGVYLEGSPDNPSQEVPYNGWYGTADRSLNVYLPTFNPQTQQVEPVLHSKRPGDVGYNVLRNDIFKDNPRVVHTVGLFSGRGQPAPLIQYAPRRAATQGGLIQGYAAPYSSDAEVLGAADLFNTLDK